MEHAKNTGKASSITVNYIFNLAYQIFAMMAPLITTPYISRVLGAENIGIYSYTYAIVTYFTLVANLGTNNYATRQIAYERNDVVGKSKIFYQVVAIRFLMNTVSTLVFIFMINVVFKQQYTMFFYIYIPYLLSHAFDISWFFQGMEQFKKTVFRNAFVKIVSVLVIFIFVKNSSQLDIYIWCFAIPPLIGNISLWFFLPNYLVKVPLKDIKIFKDIKVILQMFIPLVAIEVYTVVDKVMLESITSNAREIGYYEQAQKIIKLAFTFITSLSTVLMPKIAFYYENSSNEKGELDRIIKRVFQVVWSLAYPLWFGLMGICDNMVPWFYGKGYDKVKGLLLIFGVIILFSGVSNIIYTGILIPVRKQNLVTAIVCTGAIINVVFNAILIPQLLSVGAAIASVIAEGVIAVLCLFALRKYTNVGEILKMSLKYLLISIFMYIIIQMIGFVMNGGMFESIVQIFAGILFYVTVLVVTKDSMVWELIHKIMKKAKK